MTSPPAPWSDLSRSLTRFGNPAWRAIGSLRAAQHRRRSAFSTRRFRPRVYLSPSRWRERRVHGAAVPGASGAESKGDRAVKVRHRCAARSPPARVATVGLARFVPRRRASRDRPLSGVGRRSVRTHRADGCRVCFSRAARARRDVFGRWLRISAPVTSPSTRCNSTRFDDGSTRRTRRFSAAVVGILLNAARAFSTARPAATSCGLYVNVRPGSGSVTATFFATDVDRPVMITARITR